MSAAQTLNTSAITCDELIASLKGLGIERQRPVIAHASLSAFDEVQGGAEAVLEALLAVFDTLVMPTFTYKTMLVPEDGPADNGMTYGSAKDRNRMAEFYHADMPADRTMGLVPETLRRHHRARRSMHPILSFSGINAESILASQTLAEPLAPIGRLTELGGWVLLLGVDHSVNTSIHYAERVTGRKQFVRWALTPEGVVACPRFSGCSSGFEAVAPRLVHATRLVMASQACIQATSLPVLVETVKTWLKREPLALLCQRPECERCLAVRQAVLCGRL